MSKIDTLKYKTESGEEIALYPRTLMKCVTDADGKTVQDIVDEVNGKAAPSGASYVDFTDSEDRTTPPWVDVNSINGVQFDKTNNILKPYTSDEEIMDGIAFTGGTIKGITDSLTNTNSNTALSAKGGSDLKGAIDTIGTQVGTTSLSGIGDGTVTGAISSINSNLGVYSEKKNSNYSANYQDSGMTLSKGKYFVIGNATFPNSNSMICDLTLSNGGVSFSSMSKTKPARSNGWENMQIFGYTEITTNESWVNFNVTCSSGGGASNDIYGAYIQAIKIA